MCLMNKGESWRLPGQYSFPFPSLMDPFVLMSSLKSSPESSTFFSPYPSQVYCQFFHLVLAFILSHYAFSVIYSPYCS